MKKNNIIYDIFLYGLSYSLAPIISILIIPVITKEFSPDIYGDYSYVRTIISIASIICLTWIGPVILRYLNNSNPDYNRNKENIHIMILVGSIFFIIITGIFIGFTQKVLIFFVTIDFFFKSLVELMYANFKANAKVKRYFIYNILSVIFNYLIFLILFYLGKNSIVIIFIGAIVFNFVLILITLIKGKKHKLIYRTFNKDKILEMTRFGLPFVLINISGILLNSGDRIVIKTTLTEGAKYLGIYTVNYNIYSQMISIIIVIITSLIPSYLYPLYDEGDTGGYKKGLREFIYLYLTIVTIINVYVMLNYQNINYVLMDQSYVISSNLPVVLVVGYIFFGLYQLVANYFVACKKTHVISYFIIFSAILNIVLNIIFIPILGYEFAAISTFISFLINFIVANFMVKTKLGDIINKPSWILIILNVLIFILSYFIRFDIIFNNKILNLIYLIFSAAILVIMFIAYFIKLNSKKDSVLK